MTKEERIAIYTDTIAAVRSGAYGDGSKNGIVMIPNVEQTSKFYSRELIPTNINNNFDETIEVVNNDCFYAANELVNQGHKVAVLNMASRSFPGGGVLKGSGAQEENIFRRSNLFMSLYKYSPIGKQFGLQVEQDQYPLDANFGGIFSQNVFVFRQSEDKNYAPLKIPFMVDVITVAAVKKPTLTTDGKLTEEMVVAEKNKIRTILNIALDNSETVLVLGAFGCGAFKTPPSEMAKLFHEVLIEETYKNKFEKIIFAIIDDHNSYGEHNPKGNYQPFADEFKNGL